jgi:hypothetical protein
MVDLVELARQAHALNILDEDLQPGVLDMSKVAPTARPEVVDNDALRDILSTEESLDEMRADKTQPSRH